jgi:hypothetical protein
MDLTSKENALAKAVEIRQESNEILSRLEKLLNSPEVQMQGESSDTLTSEPEIVDEANTLMNEIIAQDRALQWILWKELMDRAASQVDQNLQEEEYQKAGVSYRSV